MSGKTERPTIKVSNLSFLFDVTLPSLSANVTLPSLLANITLPRTVIGLDCMVGVDCTDCPFQQILVDDLDEPGVKRRNKALFSHKLNGPGLRYEIGTSLLSNDIVWISGPFLPGDWNDLSIFRQGLMHELDEHERVEADDGYLAEAPRYVVCPKSAENINDKDENVKKSRRRAQGRIEVLNAHIKNWKCISNKLVCKGTPIEMLKKHEKMFVACVIIKQISMELGYGELYELGANYE